MAAGSAATFGDPVVGLEPLRGKGGAAGAEIRDKGEDRDRKRTASARMRPITPFADKTQALPEPFPRVRSRQQDSPRDRFRSGNRARRGAVVKEKEPPPLPA